MPKATTLRRSARTKPPRTDPLRSGRGDRPTATNRKSSKKTSGKTKREIWLFSLPIELIQNITSHLSLAECLCLTLTCKKAAATIGTDIWEAFSSSGGWTWDHDLFWNCNTFFEYLLRDLGGRAAYCKKCHIIHPDMLPPRVRRQTRLTLRCLGEYAEIDYLPSQGEMGYRLVFEHIARAMKGSEGQLCGDGNGPSIDLLRGDFVIEKPAENLSWRLASSGRYIHGNLILCHVHTFRSLNQRQKTLYPKQVFCLPVRLCPHQSTMSRYIRTRRTNGPLLTHAIASAFPKALQKDVDMSVFRTPTVLEQEQMSAPEARHGTIYRCPSCPTKYQVKLAAGELKIMTWHCFGRDLVQAENYWKSFVRRHQFLLGPDERNDEWSSHSRSFPDFACE